MNYDIIVIGAGVIGSAVARELSKYNAKIALIEKSEDICTGTSKANSAIIHAGFDAKPGTLMADMNVKGNHMMTQLSQKLDIPLKRCGAMVLCFDKESLPKLDELYQRGLKNQVPNLKILTRSKALELEPNLTDEVCGALYAPTSAIVCPFEMTLAFAENANVNGVEFYFDNEVLNIEKNSDIYQVTTSKDLFTSKVIVNCAGVYGDVLHNMVCDNRIEIIPRKGEYVLCDKSVASIVNTTLFQLPTSLGKGILVSPTVHGNLILGPTALDVEDKEDISTSSNGIKTVLQKAALSIKNLPTRQAITSFTGLRAHTKKEDFTLSANGQGFFDAIGIESPGLSSAPAIAQYMGDMVVQYLDLSKKDNFIDKRKGIIKSAELDFEQRAELIKSNPSYGQIICRCEMVSEGEIIDSITRPLGAKTLDGVKRRTRAGMGRCQSGFCAPKVMEILSKTLDIPYEKLRKNSENSYLVVGKTDKGGVPRE
ncbi:MAG: NAD(P)/FAD-dependent oxidoreductase [Clostridia bacterium]